MLVAECGKGFYGPNCQNECGKCVHTCSKIDGTCPNSECTDNYTGPKCNICEWVKKLFFL